MTGQLARDMDAAYATGEEAFLASEPAQQSRLLGSLYTSILPATDTQLSYLERLHAGDSPAEHTDIEQFIGHWIGVRDLLSPTNVTAHPDAALGSRLTAAYQPVGAYLDRLFLQEQEAGHSNQVDASANAARTTGFIVGAAVLGVMIGVLLLLFGIRGIRRNLEPGQEQRNSGSASPLVRRRPSWRTSATWSSRRSAPRPTASPGSPTSGPPQTP